MQLSRRSLIIAAPALALPAPALPRTQRLATRQQLEAAFARLPETARAIEAESGGRFGFAILHSRTGAMASHRSDERFPMCSTFKLFLAAQILDAGRRRQLSLAEKLPITAADMVDHAPFTAPRIGGTATILDLVRAIVTNSDNPATNLLLRRIGGPAAHTAWLRSIGDETTRLDRDEPAMSEGLPGDLRDTSTPAAMLRTSQRLLLGQQTPAADRALLQSLMAASETGSDMVRAGLSPNWREGNKTGSGARGIRTIISLIRPARPHPEGPILLVLMLAEAERDMALRNRHHARFARDLMAALASHDADLS